MSKEEFIELLCSATWEAAELEIRRRHYDHFEIPDKERQIDRLLKEMLEFMANHAAKNC